MSSEFPNGAGENCLLNAEETPIRNSQKITNSLWAISRWVFILKVNGGEEEGFLRRELKAFTSFPKKKSHSK